MNDLFDKYEDYVPTINPGLLRLTKLFIFMSFVGHMMACGWYYAGNSSVEGESWLDEYCPGDGIDPELCFRNHPYASRYLGSLYWSFATMATVGYKPTHPSECCRLFLMLNGLP